MKLRPVVLSLIAALPLVVVLGCDGDGELSLEEYFNEILALDNENRGEAERLKTEYSTAMDDADDDEEVASLFWEARAATRARVREFIADLERIKPPPEARQAHEEYLAILIEGADFSGDVDERAQRATSFEEAVETYGALDGPMYTDIVERGRLACFVLQGIADDNDIDVDLGCSED